VDAWFGKSCKFLQARLGLARYGTHGASPFGRTSTLAALNQQACLELAVAGNDEPLAPIALELHVQH
jgi:hypothetical protein